MGRRCPECYTELPDDALWVCPHCGYTLRLPGTAKAGILLMVVGLGLLGAYVYGPNDLGLTSGFLPTDIANLLITEFPLLVLGSFGLGALLAAAAALKIRSEQARAAAA